MYEYLNGLPFPEKRNILLELLLKNIGIGDLKRSLTHLERLLELFDELPAEIRFFEIKILASELNALLRHLSHSYKVPAHYSEETYQLFRQQISSCTLFSQLQKSVIAMTEGYLVLIRDHSRRQYSNLIRGCLDYIDFHYAESVTLTELANRFSVSDTYLSSRFQQETGETFIAYLNKVRIRYACTLLEKLQISMQKVAELCGFSSSNYFARVFQQQMGMSPTSYRKQSERF